MNKDLTGSVAYPGHSKGPSNWGKFDPAEPWRKKRISRERRPFCQFWDPTQPILILGCLCCMYLPASPSTVALIRMLLWKTRHMFSRNVCRISSSSDNAQMAMRILQWTRPAEVEPYTQLKAFCRACANWSSGYWKPKYIDSCKFVWYAKFRE